MLSCEGLLLVVTQASQCLWLVDHLGSCSPEKTVVGCDPGESMFVVGREWIPVLCMSQFVN